MRESGFLWGPENHSYGVNGFMVYGPTGKALKNKIESAYRQIFLKENFFEIETPVLYPTKAWESSGHYSRHSDEMFTTSTSDGVKLCGRPEIATTVFSLYPLLSTHFKGYEPIKVFLSGISLPNDLQTEWQTRTRQYTAHEGHLIFTQLNYDFDKTIEYLRNLAFQFMESIGIPHDSLVFSEKVGPDQPFYASKAYGLYYRNPGEEDLELLGIQYRKDHDFKAHNITSQSKTSEANQYPHDFEISFSTDRPLLVILKHSLSLDGDREYRNLTTTVSPFAFAILPVNKSESIEFINSKIVPIFNNKFGQTPILTQESMARRYQTIDLMGILFSVVVDKNNQLFIRLRDTGTQVNISIETLTNLVTTSSTIDDLLANIKLLFL